MRVLSFARHAAGAAAEATLVGAVAVALMFNIAAATGNGPAGAGDTLAGGSLPTGTISMGISAARVSAMTYGSNVAFDATVKGRLAPKGEVYVTVICRQGGDVVYQWSASPDFTFPLEQQDGLKALGHIWDPSVDASCSGTLIYNDGARTPTIVALDKVGFATSGN